MTNCESKYKAGGNWYICQLPKSHGGKHINSITWSDDDQI